MIWPAIVLVLLLVVPGAILGVASGLRSGRALALGPALTFAVTGLAGWLYGAIDVGFSTLTAALAWAAMIVAVEGIRARTARRPERALSIARSSSASAMA